MRKDTRSSTARARSSLASVMLLAAFDGPIALELEAPHSGEIRADDSVIECPDLSMDHATSTRRGRRHVFRAPAAGAYHVVAESPFFPAWIVARDAAGALRGESGLAAPGFGAALDLSLEKEDVISIDVCAVENGGPYTVEVGAGPLSEPDPAWWKAAMERAERNLRRVEDESAEDREAIAWARFALGQACARNRRFDDARRHLDESLRLWRELSHRDWEARALEELAACARDASDMTTWVARAEDAFEASKEQLGIRHRETVRRRVNLAQAYDTVGRNDEALAIYRGLLADFHDTGPHPSLPVVLYELAGIVAETQSPDAALPVSARAVEEFRRRGVAAELAHALLGHANNLSQTRRFAAADDAFRESLELFEDVGDRAGVAAVWSNLSLHFAAQQRMAQQIDAIERSLAIKREIYEGPNLSLATGLNNYAFVLEGIGRREEAVGLYEEALSIARGLLGDEHFTVGTYLVNQGVAFSGLGRLDEADAALSEAARIFVAVDRDDHQNADQCRFSRAELARRQGRFDETERILNDVIDRTAARFGPQHPNAFRALKALAEAAAQHGDTPKAIDAYTRAVAAHPGRPDVSVLRCRIESARLERRPDTIREMIRGFMDDLDAQGRTYSVAIELSNLGQLADQLGMASLALRIHEAALELKRELLPPQDVSLAWSLQSIGGCLRSLGRFDDARPPYEAALESLRATFGEDHLEVGRATANLAACLWDQGLLSEARPLMEQALRIRGETLGPNHPETASSISDMGALLESEGDLEGALDHYVRAREALRGNSGSPSQLTARTCSNYGLILKRLGRAEEAEIALHESIAIYTELYGENSPGLTVALHNLGGLLVDEGRLDEATQTIERALAVREHVLGDGHPYVAMTLGLRAKCRERRGDVAGALADLLRGLEIRERHLVRQLWTLSEAERFEWADGHRPYLDQILHVTASHPDLIAARRIYERVLRWKGIVSRGLIDQSELLRRRLTGPERERIDEFAEVLTELERSAARGAPPIDLVRRKNDIERSLARASGDPGRDLAASVDEISGRLQEDEALLDYVVYREPVEEYRGEAQSGAPYLSVFILRPQREVVRIDLGRLAPIETTADQVLASARGFGREVRVDATRAIEPLVWTPCIPHLDGVHRVFVVPDGPIALLPFAALRVDGRYLVEGHEFVYVQSALDLVLPPASTRSPAGILLVGGVDYGARAADDDAASGEESFAALPGSLHEIESIADTFRATHAGDGVALLTGSDATEAGLADAVKGRRYVHLATHGDYSRVDGPTPAIGQARRTAAWRALSSQLALAGANAGDTGRLTAEEVAWLDLDAAELVVLSACRSGAGAPTNGESIIGLRRALRRAGARASLTSLWRIDDADTAMFMRSFYEHLWTGRLSKSEALRRTQLDAIERERRGGDAGSASLSWAAFILEGDWR